MRNTEPIREEHRALLPHIEGIREAADLIGTVAPEQADLAVRAVLEFLHHHLIPHAKEEGRFLYPTVGRLLGSMEATRTMTLDHMEVGRLTLQLERAAEEKDERMMRRLLYGLYHLLRLHFAKEEEVYLPILDERLPAKEAAELFAAIRADGERPMP